MESFQVKENKWELGYVLNQRSQMIVDFMEFSDYKTLDALINIPVETIVKLMDDYEGYLKTEYKPSTIEAKISAIEYFYKLNGFKFSPVKSYERTRFMDEGVPAE